MKKWICLLLTIMTAATCAISVAEGVDTETYMSYYRSAIKECERYDYMDYGDGSVGYQYAFVYLSEGDAIPALLLAEVSPDQVRYIKVFRYSPEEKRLLESLQPLNEYRAWLCAGEGGRGLLLWYSDGAYDAGIFEILVSGETLEYRDLWKGSNDGNWPADIPKTDIVWTDVSKDNLPATASVQAADFGEDESFDADLPDLSSGELDHEALNSDDVMGLLEQLLVKMGPYSIVSYDRGQEIDVRVSDDGTMMIVDANLDIRTDPENFVTYTRELSPAGT